VTAAAAVFQAAELDDVVAKARAASDGYAAEVLRSGRLSVGLYLVAAGGVDDQTPHDEDEVYYVVRGRSMFLVDGHEHAARPGSLLFVPAGAVHRFHDVSDELVLVVFWAPPEGSVAAQREELR
jgi:mannose-6-phosphate isomerase-like protein (cupin superfamily)